MIADGWCYLFLPIMWRSAKGGNCDITVACTMITGTFPLIYCLMVAYDSMLMDLTQISL